MQGVGDQKVKGAQDAEERDDIRRGLPGTAERLSGSEELSE